MIALFVTCGGLGRMPIAPGTWGSLPAIPLVWLLHMAGGGGAVVAGTVLITVAGYFATRVYLDGRLDDPKEVVIDEVAGQMIALWPLSIALQMTGADPWIFPWPGWVGAFILFRFFDIVKPPPIRYFDRPGAMGVMVDDVVAGAMAGLVMLIAAGVSHGWFV